jgi:hypothetical protein
MTQLAQARAGEEARTVLREHALLGVIVAGYFIGGAFVARHLGVAYQVAPNLRLYALLLPVTLLLALCWHVVSVMLFVRPERLTRHLIDSLRPYFTLRRLAFALPALVLIPVFAATFTFLKTTIPALNPYSWDPLFTRADEVLHLGIHPWAWMHPVLGHALVTGALSVSYQLWFFVMYGVLILQAFDTRRPRLRRRFLLSFVISWILLGTFGAVAFASMGPCYDPSLGQNAGPYAPLMAYLRETSKVVPVWALDVQQMLWDSYVQNRVGLGSGISAMPSMHIATTVLLALFGWRFSRTAGIALTAYAVLIFVGSVHLAWHYAIDGYLGALGAWLVWVAVGQAQSRLSRATEIRTATAAG